MIDKFSLFQVKLVYVMLFQVKSSQAIYVTLGQVRLCSEILH
jgi:hypothetical protein